MVIAGRFVTFQRLNYPERGPSEEGEDAVVVVNAATSQTVVRTRTLSVAEHPANGLAGAQLTDLDLREDGGLAWIARLGSDDPNDTRYEVRGEKPKSSSAKLSDGSLLDSGPDVEPGSLAQGERFVYWTKAGAAMRARGSGGN